MTHERIENSSPDQLRGDVLRSINVADITVRQYQDAVRSAEAETGLTQAFLDYIDCMTQKTPHPPVSVLPPSVTPVRRRHTRLDRIIGALVGDQPSSVQNEIFYPQSHYFYAYYSCDYENPAMAGLINPPSHLTPQKIWDLINHEPTLKAEQRRYIPPLYDLEQEPELERGNFTTFITVRLVQGGPNGFHLTPDRMDRAITHLENTVRNPAGEVPETEEKKAFLKNKRMMNKHLGDAPWKIGKQMQEDLRNVSSSLVRASEHRLIGFPKPFLFETSHGGPQFQWDVTTGLLYQYTDNTHMTVVQPNELVSLTPGLLRYFRVLI